MGVFHLITISWYFEYTSTAFENTCKPESAADRSPDTSRLFSLSANVPRFPLAAFPSTAQECRIQKALAIKREPHAVGNSGPGESTTGAVCHALTGVSERTDKSTLILHKET